MLLCDGCSWAPCTYLSLSIKRLSISMGGGHCEPAGSLLAALKKAPETPPKIVRNRPQDFAVAVRDGFDVNVMIRPS